jgi:hypothetical protein
MLFLILVLFYSTMAAQSQQASDSLLERRTLQNCIRYALVHQPSVQESLVDEEIAERTIQGKLVSSTEPELQRAA